VGGDPKKEPLTSQIWARGWLQLDKGGTTTWEPSLLRASAPRGKVSIGHRGIPMRNCHNFAFLLNSSILPTPSTPSWPSRTKQSLEGEERRTTNCVLFHRRPLAWGRPGVKEEKVFLLDESSWSLNTGQDWTWNNWKWPKMYGACLKLYLMGTEGQLQFSECLTGNDEKVYSS
jgi:hypothetical protein